MTKKFDAGWFDLKNYSKLKELDLQGWYEQLFIRNLVNFWISSNDFSKNSESRIGDLPYTASEWAKIVKVNPIFSFLQDDVPWDIWRDHGLPRYSPDTYSVFGTPAIDAWDIVNDNCLNDVWKACESFNMEADDWISPSQEDLELIGTPVCDLYNKRGLFRVDTTNVTIDLSVSNKQLIHDFRRWLLEYRKINGDQPGLKMFTEIKISDWVTSRVLPYIDLMLVSTIEGKRLKQSQYSDLIFQDVHQDLDPVERLRKTIIPKAKELLRDETVKAIKAQLQS